MSLRKEPMLVDGIAIACDAAGCDAHTDLVPGYEFDAFDADYLRDIEAAGWIIDDKDYCPEHAHLANAEGA